MDEAPCCLVSPTFPVPHLPTALCSGPAGPARIRPPCHCTRCTLRPDALLALLFPVPIANTASAFKARLLLSFPCLSLLVHQTDQLLLPFPIWCVPVVCLVVELGRKRYHPHCLSQKPKGTRQRRPDRQPTSETPTALLDASSTAPGMSEQRDHSSGSG